MLILVSLTETLHSDSKQVYVTSLIKEAGEVVGFRTGTISEAELFSTQANAAELRAVIAIAFNSSFDERDVNFTGVNFIAA